MSPEQNPRGDLAALRIERDDERGESRLALAPIAGWTIAIAAIALAGWFVWSRWIAPRRYPLVEVVTVKPAVIVSNPALLTASGYLVADRQATITPKISGRVIRLHFDTGSRVAAGDVLAVLESDELQAQLREAEASYAEAAREYARQRSLFAEGVTSRALLDGAEAQRDVAAARVERLRVILRDTVVRAPFGGTIIAKEVEIGEMVAPVSFSGSGSSSDSGSIATLADLRTLEVEADVNENNLAQVRIGQPAEVTVDAFPGKKWHGRLRQVVPTADRAKGSVKVKVSILDPGEGLLPEMSASVSFLETARTTEELREPPRIWVPQTAVASDESGAYVMLLAADTGKVVKRRVTVGLTREGRAEIARGLAEGDRVVAKDVAALAEGERVRIAEE